MKTTVIVVPCYNEADRLRVDAFERFCAATNRVRFIFVNDGSTDGTAGVLEGLRRRNPARYSVLRLQPNQGKAEAVRKGMRAALAGDATYAGYWDADLAAPLQEIPRLIGVLEKRPDLEMVFGSRVQLLGRSIRRKSYRHYLGRVFATAASMALELPVYDTQCGAKLFRVSPSTAALFAEPFCSGWIFDVEIIARLIASRRGSGLPGALEVIYELPLDRWHEVGDSRVRTGDLLRAIVAIGEIRRRYFSRG